MILQRLHFFLFCVRRMILYQIVVRNSKRVFLLMTMCTSLMRRTSWPMLILIVELLSTLKLPQKTDRSTVNGITFPDPVKNPSAFPATIKLTLLLISSIPLITFWTRTFYGTWFQQLLCHSTTLMIESRFPNNTLNHQFTNLEQTHIRCFLHCERWTVRGRVCMSALQSFKESPYRMDEWTKQLLRLKSWVISGSLEQWMVFRRL